jgi:DtxR family Mn-dependent transcriptional regulator
MATSDGGLTRGLTAGQCDVQSGMMRPNLTHAIEDYIKAIHQLTLSGGRATTNRLAERLGVTPASVTGMVKKLAATRPPLLVYSKHRGVVLTQEGTRVALEIIRHHRLLELYLVQVLGYDWDAVHDEADRLEHVISEEFEERIARVLGDPDRDPHGDPIPDRDLQMLADSGVLLEALRPGEQAVVERVLDTSAEVLQRLGEAGLVPGARLTVLSVDAAQDVMVVQVAERTTPSDLGTDLLHTVQVLRT